MFWLNGNRMRLVVVGVVAVMVLGGGTAKADFTFGEPTKVPNVNSSGRDCDPSISADGLELYFNSLRSGGSGGFDLWVAKRASIDVDWEQPENLGPTVNAATDDHDPSISADKLTLYFCGYLRSGGKGSGDLWATRRATISDPWDTPVNLGSNVNGPNDEMDPYPSAADQGLYFCSDRPNGHGNYDIYISTRQTSEQVPEGFWSIPINLGPNVNTSYSDHSPSISADGLTLFFCSNRPGGYGSCDLWMTTRPT
jgi:Tol biopolymer transport system component